jgi:aspartokinase-like uncharacterized kinase
VAIIKRTFPDPDDPIFSGAFTVIFPIRLEESTDAAEASPEQASDTSETESDRRTAS